MINIPHIDLKIWNPEFKTIEIIQSLQQTGHAEIRLDGEGSDCTTLGLYKILDTVCDNLGFAPESISIRTCNQLEHHSRYKIIKRPPLYIESGQKFANAHDFTDKNWTTIKHFGLFVSRSSWQRLWIASHVWQNWADKTELTYHYNCQVDYHKLHLGLDELSYQATKPEMKTATDFVQQLPIVNDTVDQYPILTPAHFSIAKLYSDFFAEIVCETFLSGNTFYPTEKTWRPLVCQTPFLTLGPRNFLSNLQKLGFKTFGQWWDESYDQDADLDNGRVAIRSILDTLNRLSKLSISELEAMYIDMLPTLLHNRQRFLTLSPQEFKKLWP